ncbi:MAG: hypothetical protein ACK4UN_06850 [Limisphaerales bacterium]
MSAKPTNNRPRAHWPRLLGGTFLVHILFPGSLVFLGTTGMGLESMGLAVLIAIYCLPAIWSVFILIKFRGFGERIVGGCSAVVSLLWL